MRIGKIIIIFIYYNMTSKTLISRCLLYVHTLLKDVVDLVQVQSASVGLRGPSGYPDYPDPLDCAALSDFVNAQLVYPDFMD